MIPSLLLALAIPLAVDTLAVCPDAFRDELAPWLAHRRQQGHQVVVISNRVTADQLRNEVRKRAADGLRFLVLVGDAAPASSRMPTATSVPTAHVPAKVNLRFGSEPEIASDNWFADLDDDRVPDLAVGRLTADSPAELRLMIAKILAYEACTDFGPWRRQINFIAGLGGFGAVADGVLEAAAKSVITSGVPATYATTMAYASWQSPYCPDPRQFGRVARERMDEGCLFWVYLGHGSDRELDRVRTPVGTFPILVAEDTRRLTARHGQSIACLLACYTGAFDWPDDCLAEELLRSPGGPVAVLCGTRVMMPYGLSVIGQELLEVAFAEHPATLGEAVLRAKQCSMRNSADAHRGPLDAVAWAISPGGADLAAERAEHLDLFTLLGDPLLQLAWPETIELKCAASVAPGGRLAVSGSSPIAGEATLELVVRRDRLRFTPPRRVTFDSARLGEYDEVYARANSPALATTRRALPAGQFQVEFAVPTNASGACHVRAFVTGTTACALGARDVRIESHE